MNKWMNEWKQNVPVVMPIATHSPNDKVSHSRRAESSNKPLQKQLNLQPMGSRTTAQNSSPSTTCWKKRKEYDATTTLSLRENAGICWVGRWAVPRASLGVFQIRKVSHPSWDRNPDGPACTNFYRFFKIFFNV